VGRALIIYFSWDTEAESMLNHVRWSRIGKLIN
jgi:hypothetical protein